MAQPMITYVSGILHHVTRVLLLCWRRVLRISAIAGGIGVLLVEIAATLATHRIPDGAAQLVALVLGATLAYAAAITIIAEEVLIGLVDVVRLMLGEAEAGARIAANAAEHEAGAMRSGLLQTFGLASTSSLLARVGARTARRTAPPSPTRAVDDSEGDHDQDADEEATDETLADLSPNANAGAALPPVGPPVRADLLPRIGWTDEHEAIRLDRRERAAISMPGERSATPDPLEEPAAERAALSPDLPEATLRPDVAEAAPALAQVTGLAEPVAWHPEDAPLPGPGTWHDPMTTFDDEEEFGGLPPSDSFAAPPPAATTRPLSQITQPLEQTEQAEPAAAPRGSVWDHISQVLAGHPVAPLSVEPADSVEPAQAHEARATGDQT